VSAISNLSVLLQRVRSLGTFSDNHDNARFLAAQSDTSLYMGALAWVVLSDGIPCERPPRPPHTHAAASLRVDKPVV